MRPKALTCITVVLLVLTAASAYGACSGCSVSKSQYTEIAVTSPESLNPTVEVCAPSNPASPTPVNLSVSANDSDLCGDPYPISDSPLSYNWTGDVTGDGASKTFYATYPGIFHTTCTVDDDGFCFNDSSTGVNWTITVKGLTGLSNPGDVHRDASVVFTASGTFGTTGTVSWSGLESSTSFSGPADSIATTTYTTGGPQKVTATYCNTSFSVEFVVLVPCTSCCAHPDCSETNPCCWYDPTVGNPCESAF